MGLVRHYAPAGAGPTAMLHLALRTAACRCDDDAQQPGSRSAVGASQGFHSRHCEGMAIRTISQTMTVTHVSLT